MTRRRVPRWIRQHRATTAPRRGASSARTVARRLDERQPPLDHRPLIL